MTTPQMLAVCLLSAVPSLAAAQNSAPTAEPRDPPKWSMGVGLGIGDAQFYGYEMYSAGVIGIPGDYWIDSAPGVASIIAPRLSVLAERRVGDAVFVTFSVSATYGQSQNQLSPALSAHKLVLEGDLGVRHVLNPKGIVELSWFATTGVRYVNTATATSIGVWDPEAQTWVAENANFRGHTFAVGVAAGLALERELIENLSLRLSTTVLGASYGLASASVTAGDGSSDSRGDEFDVGVRLSPMLALRYAF